MSIKKALKKEKSKRRRDILLSMFLIVFMAYFVVVLVENGVLTGFDIYFSFVYVLGIGILLLINILRTLSEEKMSFEVKEDRLLIDGGYLSPNYLLPISRVLYVDVEKTSKNDFNVILVTKKSKKKKYKDFGELYIKNKYTSALDYMAENYEKDSEFSYIEVKNSGARKYYLIYILYKNSEDIAFSKEALKYVKDFVNEYKL